MTSTIDWTGQLEAYHEDGRVMPVSAQKSVAGEYYLAGGHFQFSDWYNGFHYENGASVVPNDKWRIRNVAQKPSAPILLSTEQLDRFEALLGRLEGILGGIGKGEMK